MVVRRRWPLSLDWAAAARRELGSFGRTSVIPLGMQAIEARLPFVSIMSLFWLLFSFLLSCAASAHVYNQIDFCCSSTHILSAFVDHPRIVTKASFLPLSSVVVVFRLLLLVDVNPRFVLAYIWHCRIYLCVLVRCIYEQAQFTDLSLMRRPTRLTSAHAPSHVHHPEQTTMSEEQPRSDLLISLYASLLPLLVRILELTQAADAGSAQARMTLWNAVRIPLFLPQEISVSTSWLL